MNKNLYIDRFIFWTENETEKIPDVSFIPPMLRRRMSIVEKIAISMASKIAQESGDYRVVFASRFGEWNQTVKLIQQFYNDHEMSPMGFSNSVHNAAMGHFSLLTHNKSSYTSIAGGERTIETGLLDAATSEKPVLFIYSEEYNPTEYETILDKKFLSHGCAIFIDKDGKNKYQLVSNNEKMQPLSFEKLKEYLEHNVNIETSNWSLLKK